MKLFYPYFNLFVKKGTENYRLDLLIKLSGKYKLDTIDQKWDGKAWLVNFYFEADSEYEKVGNVQLQEYSINLKPEDVKQLEKIKMLVYSMSKLEADSAKPEEEGGGQTGSGDGEIEP